MSDLPNKNLYVTVTAAAKILGVSIDTVRRWDAQGTLHSTRLDGKNRFFLKSELKSFRKTRPLSISEAASALSVSVSTLRRLEKKGVVMADRAGNGERMYSPEKVREILDSRKKGRQSGVNLFAPIPTTVQAMNNAPVETDLASNSYAPPDQIPPSQNGEGIRGGVVNNGRFWKKNHIVQHVGQLNAVGSYVGGPAKSIKFGHQPPEYKKGIIILSFLLLLSTGIFAFTVLRDVTNPRKTALSDATIAGLNAYAHLSPEQRAAAAQAQVLAASTIKGVFTVNIKSLFNENIKTSNKNLDLGTGEITASNVVYSIAQTSGDITLGTGLTMSGNVLSGSAGSNSFSTITVGSTNITAGSPTDTLILSAGSNISLSTSSKTITISANVPSITNYWALNGNNLYPTSTSYSVGIGNQAPTTTLDVTGTFLVSGAATFGDTTTFNSITYTWPGSQTSNFVLSTDGSGNLSWVNPGVLPTTNYFTISNGAIYPTNVTLDFLVGGSSSASAKFGLVNVVSGTPSIQISGTTVLTGTTLGSGVVNSSLTSVGALASGSIASGFGTISTTNTITGTVLNGTTGINTGAGAGTQRIDSSGNLTNIGTTQFNTITYTWPVSQSGGFVLQTDGAGLLSWVSPSGPGFGTNYWSLGTGTIYPTNTSLDLLLGSAATASARFAVININSGTPTASLSAGAAGATYLTAAGTLQTTANQTLTLGGDTTGNITISPLNGSGTTTNTGIFNLSPGKAYQIGGTEVLSATTLGTAVVTSSLTTVGALTSGSIATGFGTISTGNTITTTSTLTGGTVNASTGSIQTASTDRISNGGNLVNIGTTQFNTQTYTWPAAGQSANYVLVTNGSGTLSWTDPGEIPNVNFWAQTNGALYPRNSTVDLLVGATATTSAKFAVLNVNSGTPIASISGNLIVYPYTGLGGVVGIGTTNPTSTLHIVTASGDAIINLAGNSGTQRIQSNGGAWLSSNGSTSAMNASTTDELRIGSVAKFSVTATAGNLASGSTYQINAIDVLSSTTLGSGVVNSSLTSVGALASGSIASGFGTISTTNTITGTVLNGTTGINTGAGAGTQRIDSSGNLTNIGTTQFNSITYTWPGSQGSNYILQTDGAGSLSWVPASGGGIGTNYWSLGTGTIFPTNTSLDLLVGASATTSAKFAVINIAGGTPTASLSAGLNGGTYLTAAGRLQTTANQNLTLGGDTTGNITLSPLNGTGNTTINGTTTLNGLTYTWPSSQSNSYILQTDGNGTLSWINATGGGVGTNYWSLGNGTIFPTNTALDLLIGSSATSSAKFAFMNVSSGTPTASLSAGAAGGAYLTATGTLSTTAMQQLTLGSSTSNTVAVANANNFLAGQTTGKIGFGGAVSSSDYLINITLDSTQDWSRGINLTQANDSAEDSIVFNITNTSNPGSITSGTSRSITNNSFSLTPTATLTSNSALSFLSTIGTNQSISLANVSLGDVSGATARTATLTTVNQISLDGSLTINDTASGGLTSSQTMNGENISITGSPTLTALTDGYSITTQGVAINNTYSSAGNANLTVTSRGIISTVGGDLTTTGTTAHYAGLFTVSGSADENYGVYINNTTGAATNYGLYIVDANEYSLYLASTDGDAASGITFGADTNLYRSAANTLKTDDDFQANTIATGTTQRISSGGNLTNIGTTQFNTITYTWPSSQTGGYVLQTNGSGTLSWASALSTGYFTVANGLLYPVNTSLDFAVGGTSSDSAKFLIANMNPGSGTPTASISAGTAGAIILTATGTVQTTAGQTLTLGGTTTGSINVGTDATARLVTVGNNTGASALSFTSGTGAQTFSSKVVSGTTTGSAFVFSDNSLTTGTGLDLSSTSLTSGKLARIAPVFAGSSVTGYGLFVDGVDNTTNANTDFNINSKLNLAGNAATVGVGVGVEIDTTSTVANTLYGGYFITVVNGPISSGTRNICSIYSGPSDVSTNTGGTTNIYGSYLAPSYAASADVTGSTVNVYGNYISTTGTLNTGGTINQYGVYIANGTSATTGTSTKYGLYVETPTGADTNYAVYVAGGNVNIQSLTASLGVYTDSNKNLTSTAPSSGVIGYWSRSGTTLTTANANDTVSLDANLLFKLETAHTIQISDSTTSNTAGSALTIKGAAGAATNAAGGAISITGGAGAGTGAGGALVYTGGASGAGATGNGGAISLTGGAAASTNGTGGAITLTSGAGKGTGLSGAISLLTGAADSGTATGIVSIATGNATSAVSGSISIVTGTSTGNVVSGDIVIKTGQTAGTSRNGIITIGSLTANSGASSGGIISILSGGGGTATTSGLNGGAIAVQTGAGSVAGSATSLGGSGGSFSATLGAGAAGLTSGNGGQGGTFLVSGGTGGGSTSTSGSIGGSGSAISIIAGTGGAAEGSSGTVAGAGGTISLTAGSAGSAGASGTGGAGGSIILASGASTGTAVAGQFSFTSTRAASTGTSSAFAFVDNSLTTGTGLDLSSTSLTSGKLMRIAPTFAGAGVTGYGLYIDGADSTTQTNTDYGIYSTLALSGNAAKTAYGIYSRVTSSSTTGEAAPTHFLADIFSDGSITGALAAAQTRDAFGVKTTITSTAATAQADAVLQLSGMNSQPSATGATAGTTIVYGLYTKTTATHAADAGTITNYGIYVDNGTSTTNGTSTKYGIYIAQQTLADNNVALNASSIATGDVALTMGPDGFTGSGTNGFNVGYGGATFGAGQSFLNAHSATLGNGKLNFMVNASTKMSISNTGQVAITSTQDTGTTTSSALSLAANSVTTGTVFNISATGLTTGSTLISTSTTAPTAATTIGNFQVLNTFSPTTQNGSIMYNVYAVLTNAPSSVTDSAVGLYGSTVDASSGLANTIYGVYGNVTMSGNSGRVGYGTTGVVTSSSTTADTSVGLYSVVSTTGAYASGSTAIYGVESIPSSVNATTGSSVTVAGFLDNPGNIKLTTGGTIIRYGMYIANATMDTVGTSSQTGLYVASLSGADNNYGAIFAGTNNIGIGMTAPIRQVQIQGVGQTTAALTDAGNTGGTLYVQDSGGAGNNGGAILFGAGQGYFAAIKTLLQNGGSNTVGDFAISTRNAATDTALTERMRIISTGQVGIGRTPATYNLELAGASYNTTFLITSADTVGPSITLSDTDASATAGEKWDIISTGHTATPGGGTLSFYNETDGLYRVVFGAAGQVTFNTGVTVNNTGQYLCIDTTTFEVKRNNTACSASSERFKDNINNMGYGLNEILQLRPVTYTYKPEMNMGSDLQVGLIAEEVQGIMPELVPLDAQGLPSGFDYPKLSVILTKAVQQLNAKVDNIAAGDLTSVFTVDSNNNVGLGIATPSAKLDVAGGIKIGVNGQVAGAATIAGANTGSVTIKANNNGSNWTMTLPTDAGANGSVLTTDGAGNTSWVSVASLTTPLRDEIFGVIGQATDSAAESTIFGKLAKIQDQDIAGINDKLSVFTVASDSVTIVRNLVVDAQTQFNGTIQVLQDIVLSGRIKHKDQDTAGFAVIKNGDQQVTVAFDRPYETAPVVNVTAQDSSGSAYVKDVTANGFTIVSSSTASADLKLSWNATLVETPRTSTDSGQLNP